MDDREKDCRQGKKVLIVIAVTLLLFLVGILQNCNATCMEQWINHHRIEPLDFVLWKTKLCELFKGPSCNSSMRITLADHTDAVLNSNIHENDNYPVVLVLNLSSFQNKYQENMWQDGQHKDITNTYNTGFNFPFLAEDRTDFDFNITSKSKYMLCNKKDENEGNAIVLERRSTIFRVNDIFNDYSIKKKRNYIHIMILARQDSDCSILLKEALIFMTLVNFKPWTYILTKKKYHPNISIVQYFNQNKIYVTEDGQSFIWYWMWGINILLISLLVRIWNFTGKMFEAKPLYRFTRSTFPTYYVCNPSLISTHTPFTDILRTYFRDRAWFRKILLIGSSYCTTFLMIKIVSGMTGVIDSNQVVFISVLFNVLLLVLFMTECSAKYKNQNMKCLPEPCEAFELSILISPMLLCLIRSFVEISSALYQNLSSYDKIVKLFSYLSKKMGNYILLKVSSTVFIIIFIALACGIKFNHHLLAIIFDVFIFSLVGVDLSNIMYWIFRCLVFFFQFGCIQYIVYACLQVFLNSYHQCAEWMFSHQEWIPLIFLCISYLRDVSNEYCTVLKQCLQPVVSLNMFNRNMECIDSENVAILAGNETKFYTAYTMRDEQGTNNSKAMLFYHHGVPHVTSKFYYELRKLLDQVLGSSLSIKKIILKEMESIFFRLSPIIITILVINTSNLSLDKFEGVQKYLVTVVLFQSYSKFFLQRVAPKIELNSNPYFKTKLQDISSQHKEVFHITNLRKRKENFPAMPIGMMIVTWVTVVIIFIFSQIEKYPLQIKITFLQLCDHLNFSKISLSSQGLIFLLYYLFLSLFLMNC